MSTRQLGMAFACVSMAVVMGCQNMSPEQQESLVWGLAGANLGMTAGNPALTAQQRAAAAAATNFANMQSQQAGNRDAAIQGRQQLTGTVQVETSVPPDSTQPYSELSILYSKLGNFLHENDGGKAITVLNRIIELDPKNSTAYAIRGEVHRGMKNLDQALADLYRALELDPKSGYAYQTRGRLFASRQEWDRALADLYRAIELDQNDATAYYVRGLVYAVKGDSDRAIADFSKCIEIDPKNHDAYLARGREYPAKDSDRAIADFSKCIEIDPKNASAYMVRGSHYLLVFPKSETMYLSNIDNAVADFTKAAELAPESAEAWKRLANSYEKRWYVWRINSDNNEAVRCYSKVIELNTKDSETYVARGTAYNEGGDLDKAIQDFSKAIEISPKLERAYFCRGDVFLARGEFDHAVSDYTSVIGLSGGTKDSCYPYVSRALAYYGLGEWEKCVVDARLAAEKDGAKPHRLALLIWLARGRQDQVREASAELKQFIQSAKAVAGDAEQEWNIKLAAFLLGDLSEPDLLQAAEANTGFPWPALKKREVLFYAGSKCLVYGDKVKAQDYFNKYLDDPGTAMSDELCRAKAELKRLVQNAAGVKK